MNIRETEVTIRGGDGDILLRRVLSAGEYVLGRDPEADLSFEAEMVSRRHARLVIDVEEFLIEDLGSCNGTFVGGQAVGGPTRFWPGQPIQLGTVTVELHRPQEGNAPEDKRSAAAADLPAAGIGHEGKYTIGEMVAQGGMGAILSAEEGSLKRRVAMKVMLRASTPEEVARFVNEARITGQLEHPSIVPVHELGVDSDGQVFYTMKFVHGITLHHVLAALGRGHPAALKDYPLGNLLTVFQKVCDALAFAHSKGVLHCDLKPANIMLGEFGEVLLMDWGLARPIHHRKPGEHLHRPGHPGGPRTVATEVVMGTPQYMSPEQARGELAILDAHSDIYSLGAILYEMLALRPSVRGSDPQAMAERVARGKTDPLSAPAVKCGGKPLHRPIPESLAAVVRKAMALEPCQRYWSVEELQNDVRAYQNGFATRAEHAGAARQVALFVNRHKAATALAAAVVVVVSWLGAKSLVEGRRAEQALSELRSQAPALRQFADIEAESGSFPAALAHLDGAAKLDPNDLPSLWRRVWLLVGMEDFARAQQAMDLASERDPENAAKADPIRPVLAAVASATTDEDRFRTDRLTALLNHLSAAEAKGEVLALSRRIKLSSEQKRDLVAHAVRDRMSIDPPPVMITATGFLQVNLSQKRLPSLEPLRGLPIDLLEASYTYLPSIEPLRGMRLMKLVASSNPELADLGPLRGMNLSELNVSSTKVSDLTPLAGMPLRILNISNTPVCDLSALDGMPLEELRASGIRAADFSLPQSLPLRILDFRSTAAAKCETFAVPTLEQLCLASTRVSDLEPLIGLTPKLRILEVENCGGIKDFTPLLKVGSLKRLATSAPMELLLPLRSHAGLEAINHRNSGYLPVSRFWAQSASVR